MKSKRLYMALSLHGRISMDFLDAIERAVDVLTLPKGHVLHASPKISEHLYFIEEGLVMAYQFEDGEKYVAQFWQAGDFVFLPQSFFDRVPSREFLELAAPSRIVHVSHRDAMGMFDAFHEAHEIYRNVLHRYYEKCRERDYESRNKTAAMRFEKLIKEYPGIEQDVSQEDIASYLGITPQSLSRIKRLNR